MFRYHDEDDGWVEEPIVTLAELEHEAEVAELAERFANQQETRGGAIDEVAAALEES